MKRAVLCVLAPACVVLAAGSAQAQPGLIGPGQYYESHDFTLNFAVRPNDVYRGIWTYRAFARETQTPPIPNVDSDLKQGTFVRIDPGAQFQSISTRPLVCAPTAEATATFTLGLDALRHATGNVEVFGKARLAPPAGLRFQSAEARSSSALGVQTGAVDARGRVRWRPIWHAAADVRANSRTGSRDPILISALDLDTGLTTDTTLWDSMVEVSGGESHWDAGLLNIDALDGQVRVVMDSPFLTTPAGSLRLEFANGLVTLSEDSGMFDGLLPPVGASSLGINMHLGDSEGAFDIGFDLGGPNTLGYDMTAQFSNDGSAYDEIPAPAGSIVLAVSGLGLLCRRRRGAQA